MYVLETADDTRIESPTAEDVARAFGLPRDDDWYLLLERDDVDLMDFTVEGGGFRVRSDMGDQPARVTASFVDESAARAMAASFLEGSESWRDQATWVEAAKIAASATAAMSTGKIPPQAIFAGVFIGGLAVLTTLSMGPWVAVWFALGFPGLIAAATITKQLEARKAASWKKASGRIVRSALRETKRNGKEAVEPDIEYEFTISFKPYRGNRPNFAEIVGDEDAKALVKRYPEGASVTVWHDPADPTKSVIDRDLPKGFAGIWVLVGVLVAIIAACAWWFILR